MMINHKFHLLGPETLGLLFKPNRRFTKSTASQKDSQPDLEATSTLAGHQIKQTAQPLTEPGMTGY